MSAPEPRWPASWIRAALPTAILTVLLDADRHGYAIAVALEERGFGRPKGGSLYPALAVLEEAGAVKAQWTEGDGGPGRRMYHLTAAGRQRLKAEATAWKTMVEALRT